MTLDCEDDIYEFLGISFESSTKEIKKAYKSRAKALHPDKNKDNPTAKEEFQKLKTFCDLLLDANQRKQYDLKYKARLAVQKRNSELDSERRRLKEQLEIREREAACRRKRTEIHTEKEKVAARIRKEWEVEAEAVAHTARQDLLRQQAEQKRKIETAGLFSQSSLLNVKWNSHLDTSLTGYNKDFLTTCLREFGTVSNLVMGKHGNAIVEFSSKVEAEDAFRHALSNIVGFPENPIILSWVATRVTPSCTSTSNLVIPTRQDDQCENHADFGDFESDILAKMARFA